MGEQKQVDSKFNLETILKELGSFGKYQILMLLLLSFRDSFLNMCNNNYMFTTTDVEYRCQVVECETEHEDHRWLTAALPNNTRCHRYHYLDNLTLPEDLSVEERFRPRNACSIDNFDRRKLVECDKWVYSNNHSIVSEFDLGCQKWKATLVGTAHNIGLIVSLMLSGIISDRYGRKTIIVGTPLVVGMFGLAKSFSFNYWMLVALEFLESALGYGNASLVLSLECVSQEKRVVFACILDMLTNFGGMFLGLISWLVPYWRHLLRIIYAPLLVVFFYIFLIDEGVRWLLTKGRREEAFRILNKVAKINNVTFSAVTKNMLEETECKKAPDEKVEDKSQLPLMKSLKSKSIWFRLISCSFCHFCSAFIFNGMLVNAANARNSANPNLSYSLMLFVSIPTRIMTAIALTKFGRKFPMASAMFLCAIFAVSASLVPKGFYWASMALFLCSKMAISFALYTLTVYTLETFPTCARNSLTNISCTIGRLGSVFAPQIPLLSAYMPSLPYIVFGLVALLAGCVMLFMPDTSSLSKLPDEVHDVEKTDQLCEDKECSKV